MRKIVLSTLMAVCLTMLMAGVAFAAHATKGDRTFTGSFTFPGSSPAGDCERCHAKATKHTSGPHGGYSASTTRCAACHTVHNAGNDKLLPGTTVTAACNFCHDLTGTEEGPYSAAKLPNNGTAVKSAHRVAGITYFSGVTAWDNAGSGSIPGGNDTTGGSVYLNNGLKGNQGKLSNTSFTCDSCHTPHAIVGSTVAKYLGESVVKQSDRSPITGKQVEAGGRYIFLTDRILKNSINGQSATTYGTAWCATCHRGRDNDQMTAINHPVDETALAYDFLNEVTLLNSHTAGDVTTAGYVYIDKNNSASGSTTRDLAIDPRSNKRLAMVAGDPLNGNAARPDGFVTYKNLAAVGGDATKTGPSCQQCHASARDVEAKFWTDDFNVTPLEGQMTFPHLSTNKSLLVEEGDDFCTNCHGLNLP